MALITCPECKNRISETFYDRFNWAVPTAFKNAISYCCFEEGDILYDTKNAYNASTWAESLKHINYMIQVKSPKRSSVLGGQVDTGLVFEQNWNSEVVFELMDYKHTNRKKLISTTQGKLFTLLYTGNLNLLKENSENPPLPILIGKELEPYRDKAASTIQNKLKNSAKNLNLFVMGYDPTNNTYTQKFSKIEASLNSIDLEYKVYDYSPKECDLENHKDFSPVVYFRCIAIDTKSVEKFRDSIKSALWTKRNREKSLIDEIKEGKKPKALFFKLANHGEFISHKDKKCSDIRVHSFAHTTIYRYRLALTKLNKIPGSLSKFLDSVFKECPNHFFSKDGFRASKSGFSIDVKAIHEHNHDMIEMAKRSRDMTSFKSRHENLQKFFLENDPFSIATEVPVWIEHGEYVLDYEDVFKTKKELTGHIDLLRYEKDGKIGIWDYKPKAYSEKNAVTQVFLYTIMLYVRTGIPLNRFICGYFDEIDIFYFDPSKVDMEQLKKQN